MLTESITFWISGENVDENFSQQKESPDDKQIILVIDDSEDALMLQKIMLETQSYDVYTARGGKEALIVLSEMPQPDLILLDMQLGDMTGAELLDLLKQQNSSIIKNVPVVFLTGMDKVPPSCAVGMIRKPVDMHELFKLVKHYIKVGHHAPYQH